MLRPEYNYKLRPEYKLLILSLKEYNVVYISILSLSEYNVVYLLILSLKNIMSFIF